MTLSPAIGSNRYCGPGALAIVSGLDTDAAAAMIRAVSGKRAVRGTSVVHMATALQRCGFRLERFMEHERGSIQGWARTTPPGVYVVGSSSHWLVIDTRNQYVCDNCTVYPLPLDRYRCRRQRVRIAWRLVATGQDSTTN